MKTFFVIEFLKNHYSLFGPTDFGGCSHKLNPVRASVICPSFCQSVWGFLAFFQNCSKDLLNFFHECRGQYGPCLSQIVFLKKFLTPECRGLSVQKKLSCFTFIDFSPKSLMDLPNFLHEFRGQ